MNTNEIKVGDRVSFPFRYRGLSFGRVTGISEPKGRLGYVWATISTEKGETTRAPIAELTKTIKQ